MVVTRDAARCADLATRVAAQGGRVVALPLTRAQPPEPAELAALQAAAAAIAGFDAVVVVSARAVDALAQAGVRLHRTRTIAVGDATARALVAASIATAAQLERPARADAIGVAAHLLAAAEPPRRVLWARAAGGRDDGIAQLRAAGVEVDARVAYHTRAVDAEEPALAEGLALIAGGGAAVVAFYAPSQVDALAALLGDLSALARGRVVAIGETTAAALRAHGVRVDGVARTPDAAAMASTIRAVYPGSP